MPPRRSARLKNPVSAPSLPPPPSPPSPPSRSPPVSPSTNSEIKSRAHHPALSQSLIPPPKSTQNTSTLISDPPDEITPVYPSDPLDEITPVYAPDPLDEITPVYASNPLDIIAPLQVPDPLDEITPIPQPQVSQKPSAPLPTTAITSESDDELTPVYPPPEIQHTSRTAHDSENIPLSSSPVKPASNVKLPRPDRTPFQALQTGERSPVRPNLVTYGKRRRAHAAVEMPSSRALGVMHDKTPDKDKQETVSEQNEGEEEYEEEEEEEEEIEKNKELEAFVKQQKALWREVDAFDLEEEIN